MLKIVGYLKDRLGEKSTWAAIGIGVTGAASLVIPWSYLFIAVAVVGALVPTSSKDDTDA